MKENKEQLNNKLKPKECCPSCRENPPSGDDYCTAKGCICHSPTPNKEEIEKQIEDSLKNTLLALGVPLDSEMAKNWLSASNIQKLKVYHIDYLLPPQVNKEEEVRVKKTLWEIISSDFSELYEVNKDYSVNCKKHNSHVTEFEIKEFARFQVEKSLSLQEKELKEKIEKLRIPKGAKGTVNGVEDTSGLTEFATDCKNQTLKQVISLLSEDKI